uniref:Uncharacterized protein n=1 Tax=Spermophilus dauricus TaxID=99837 RepID=A0A8C9QUN2_SPEDA
MAQFVCNHSEKALALVNAGVTYSNPQLAVFWHFAKVELFLQPLLRSLRLLKNNSAQTGSFKQLTVKEAVSC